ncbi:hypothetical protein IOV74_003504 [Salmonella enterica]|nr:hypothetical protein [Salmonella enterica]
MVRIACVGITVMDRIYYVEGLPTEGGKYVAKRYTEVGGGPAATAAVAAAKLGAQVDFIGRVGDDDTGNSLLAELESLGVNMWRSAIRKWAAGLRRPLPWLRRNWARRWTLLAVWAMTTPETACWRNWNPWG